MSEFTQYIFDETNRYFQQVNLLGDQLHLRFDLSCAEGETLTKDPEVYRILVQYYAAVTRFRVADTILCKVFPSIEPIFKEKREIVEKKEKQLERIILKFLQRD